MAILQTDPERFGCIEGQGDYSGPDAHHTPHSTGMIGEMEKEAPKTPARGTGRKRGRPKGSGSGRGRASSKGASPSQSPKPVTIGSVLIRVPFSLSCSDVFVVVHIWLCSFLFLNATPTWIFSLILFRKETNLQNLFDVMSSRKAVTVWSKSDFYFQALHCRDIKGFQFFPDPKKTMTAFTFPLNHNLLVSFSTSFCSLLNVFLIHIAS